MRSCPITAPSRASSVESCSGVSCGRANSVCWTTRPGVGSTTMVTRSTAAAGGCDSRSSSTSVRSARTSRIGDGRSRRRACRSPPTSPSCTCSTATPRSRRSRRIDSGSRSRVSTNDSGSRPSIGHSRSMDDSKRSSAASGTSGRTSSPRARACHTRPARPSRDERSAGRQRRHLAERPESPAVERSDREDRRVFFLDRCVSAVLRVLCVQRRDRRGSFPGSRSPAGRARPAPPPGVTTVRPGRATASTSAAVRVPATAMCTRTPRRAASRRSSSPMVCAPPSSRSSPRTSIVTTSRPLSKRGENSWAIATRSTTFNATTLNAEIAELAESFSCTDSSPRTPRALRSTS